jgi:hypothetical protein
MQLPHNQLAMFHSTVVPGFCGPRMQQSTSAMSLGGALPSCVDEDNTSREPAWRLQEATTGKVAVGIDQYSTVLLLPRHVVESQRGVPWQLFSQVRGQCHYRYLKLFRSCGTTHVCIFSWVGPGKLETRISRLCRYRACCVCCCLCGITGMFICDVTHGANLEDVSMWE